MKTTFALIAATMLLSPAIVPAAECPYNEEIDKFECSTATTPPTQVPEPGTLALMAMGIAGLALSRRRKS